MPTRSSLFRLAVVAASVLAIAAPSSAQQDADLFLAGGIPVLPMPLGVAAARLTNSGHTDIVVANGPMHRIDVLLGDGTGRFAPAAAAPLTVSGRPISVATGVLTTSGHFTHSGHLDVAAVAGSRVQVLLGDGTGRFTPPRAVPELGHEVWFAASGRFGANGDGVAAIDHERILRGAVANGTGFTPERPATAFTMSVTPSAMAVGRFTGSGYDDLALVGGEEHAVVVMRSDGAGGFLPVGKPLRVGVHPASVAVGRFTTSGHDDLVVGDQGDSVWVLLGDGRGAFRLASGMPRHIDGIGGFPGTLATGRFTDGPYDGIAIMRFWGLRVLIDVLVSDGGGRFTEAPGAPIADGVLQPPPTPVPSPPPARYVPRPDDRRLAEPAGWHATPDGPWMADGPLFVMLDAWERPGPGDMTPGSGPENIALSRTRPELGRLRDDAFGSVVEGMRDDLRKGGWNSNVDLVDEFAPCAAGRAHTFTFGVETGPPVYSKPTLVVRKRVTLVDLAGVLYEFQYSRYPNVPEGPVVGAALAELCHP
jgi:hypothetical protein